MVKTVWKYKSRAGGHKAEMLAGPIVHVTWDDDLEYTLWVEGDPNVTKRRIFVIFATGAPIQSEQTRPEYEWVHVSTFVEKNGYVWHLYESVERKLD